jgi:hypothetical protein
MYRCTQLTCAGCAVVQNACIFGFAGLTRPDQWQAANALYVTGNIGESLTLHSHYSAECPDSELMSVARNLLQNFYHAAFPAMVRDLPKMIESEQQVLRGEKRYV